MSALLDITVKIPIYTISKSVSNIKIIQTSIQTSRCGPNKSSNQVLKCDGMGTFNMAKMTSLFKFSFTSKTPQENSRKKIKMQLEFGNWSVTGRIMSTTNVCSFN